MFATECGGAGQSVSGKFLMMHALIFFRSRVEDTLDKWGRPKKANVPMPTEALPEQDRGSLPQVEVGNRGD